MAYEMNPADVYGLAHSVGAEIRQKGQELFFKHCPYCQGGGNDKNTLSVNLQTGQFKCFRVSCGKQGHFVQMARDFSYPLEYINRPAAKSYRQLPQKKVEVRSPAVDYLASRGIGETVVKQYEITTLADNPKIIAFPFFDETGILRFVKYRNTDFQKGRDKSKEWCEKDTMPILFGMKQCVDFKMLVITEGQIDSLSLSQAGIKNAVSVPTGARGFTWIDHCWDWVDRFEEIVVFGDCENGKITLADEISKRWTKPVRVVDIADYMGEKDANAILQKFGTDPLRFAVEKAKIQPVNHVKELADVENVDIYNLERVFTGIREIDRVIGGIYFGQVILLTGKRGEGKSTFMSQLIAEALDQGYKTFAYSGELMDFHFKRWLDFQLAGSNNVVVNLNEFGDETYLLTDSIVKKISDWYRGKAYIYDNNAIDDNDEFESLLETVEKAICRYGIRFVCIDNLMTALDVGMQDDIYRAQSKFVKSLKGLARKYNIAVVLVAHPKKTQSGTVTDNDDVSGTGDITNAVDITMSYSRPKDPQKDGCDGKLSVMKNRLTGKLAMGDKSIKLFYSQSTKRITSDSSGMKAYGWEAGQWTEVEPTGDLPW